MNEEPELYMILAAYEHTYRENLELISYNLTKSQATRLRKRLIKAQNDPDNDDYDKLDYHMPNPILIVRQYGVIE